MKKCGFSMIELVFVIVILGVLAAVAVPRFVTTRTDAMVAMYRSDIASTLKAIPARVFAENLDPTQGTPSGFSSWSEWIIDTAGLDTGRWYGYQSFLMPIKYTSSNSGIIEYYCGVGTMEGAPIYIDTSTGILYFDPSKFVYSVGTDTTNLCFTLASSYASGSNRAIPLTTTGAVKF